MSQAEPGAVVDLLGVLAYAELTAFDWLAEDARLAPSVSGRAALARMAAAEIAHHVRLTERIEELGADPAAAMAPFAQAFDAFHTRTASSDWLEGLVTAYVGDGLAADFYTEIAALLAAGTVAGADRPSLRDAAPTPGLTARAGPSSPRGRLTPTSKGP